MSDFAGIGLLIAMAVFALVGIVYAFVPKVRIPDLVYRTLTGLLQAGIALMIASRLFREWSSMTNFSRALQIGALAGFIAVGVANVLAAIRANSNTPTGTGTHA